MRGFLLILIFAPIFAISQIPKPYVTWIGGDNAVDQTPTQPTRPGARFGSSQWTDRDGNLWLFGGEGNSESVEGYLNDLWKYNIQEGSWIWKGGSKGTSTTNTQSKPGARRAAMSWTDQNGDFWMYGGRDVNASRLSDLWKFTVSTESWTLVSGSLSGNSQSKYYQSTSSDIIRPGGRSHASGWFSDGYLYLFGGYGYANSSTAGSLADLWKYKISTGIWTYVTGSQAINFYGSLDSPNSSYGYIENMKGLPSGRESASIIVGYIQKGAPNNTRLAWMVGGKGVGYREPKADDGLITVEGFGPNQQMWYFDMDSEKWTLFKGYAGLIQNNPQANAVTIMHGISFTSSKITSRNAAAIWFDDKGVYLYGGYGFDRNFSYDTYYPGKYDTYVEGPLDDMLFYQQKCDGVNICIPGFDNDLWSRKNGNTLINQQVNLTNQEPGSRGYSAYWKDNEGNFWIFGGLAAKEGGGDEKRSDLWVYANGSWKYVSGSLDGGAFGNYGTQGVSTSRSLGSRTGSMTAEAGNLSYIFGGFGVDANSTKGLLRDLYIYNKDEKIAEHVSNEGSSNTNAAGVYSGNMKPGSREFGQSWVDTNGNFWIFGGYGYDKTGTVGYLNDLWKYNNTDGWVFVGGSELVDQSAKKNAEKGVEDALNWPAGVTMANSWQKSDGTIYLYGGENGGIRKEIEEAYIKDFWKYNPTNKQWTWIDTYSSFWSDQYDDEGNWTGYNAPVGPSIRIGSFTWVKDDVIYMIGGASSNYEGSIISDGSTSLIFYNETNNSWSAVVNSTYSTAPSEMNGVCWIDDNGDFWAFGGVSYCSGYSCGNSARYYYRLTDALYKYNFNEKLWQTIQKATYDGTSESLGTKGIGSFSNNPGARDGVSYLGSLERTFFLFGGNSTDGLKNEVFTYEFAPGHPKILDETNISQSQFTINWSDELYADTYHLVVSPNQDLSTPNVDVSISQTTRLVNGLTAGNTYYYSLQPQNYLTNGMEAYTDTFSLKIVPPEAVISQQSVAQYQSTVAWDLANGADSVTLEVSTDNFSTIQTTIDTLLISDSPYVIKNLASGTNYSVRNRVRNNSGASGNSITIAILTKPADPLIDTLTDITTSALKVKWSPIVGATSYTIELSSNSFITKDRPDGTVLSNEAMEYTFNSLAQNTGYSVRVTASNASGNSGSSVIATATTASLPPAKPTFSDITATAFRINWSSIPGITEYLVELSSDTFNTVQYTATIGSVFADVTALNAGTAYQARVRTRNVDGVESVNSVIGHTVTIPVAPDNLNSTFTDPSTATVSWDIVKGAQTYQFDLSKDQFSSFLTGYQSKVLTEESITISSLDAGTRYYARARSVNSNDLRSNYSTTYTFSTVPSIPSNIQLASVTQATISLTWNSSSEATSYRVDVSEDNFGTLVQNGIIVTTNAVTVSSLDPGKNYQFRIAAINGSGDSPFSEKFEALTIPATPAITSITNITTTGLHLIWSSSLGATAYKVELSRDNFLSYVSNYDPYIATESRLSVVGLIGGLTYQVRLRALNTSGESPNSAVQSVVTIPRAPLALTASTVTANSFTANWETVSGANDYVVQLSEDNFTTITSTDSLQAAGTFTYEGLEGLTKYYYRAYAFNANGSSVFSNIVSVTTLQGKVNSSPNDISLTNTSIAENNDVSSLVGKFSTSDLDVTDIHTYRFIDGAGFDNALFEIQTDQLFTKQSFNFESKTSYSISVESDDQQGGTFNKVFNLSIIDVNDTPTAISLSESTTIAFSPIGTQIGTLSATDEDDTQHTYEVIDGNGFSVQGNVLSNSVVFQNRVDSVASITIRTKDSEEAFFDKVFTISINAFVDTESPQITNITEIASVLDTELPLAVSATVNDNFEMGTVSIFYRSFVEEDFKSAQIESSTTEYAFSFDSDMFEVAGIEYYFSSTDAADNSIDSKKIRTALSFAENQLEVESITKFGATLSDYQLFSIPYVFAGNNSRVDAVFDEYGGNPDNRNWRIIRYQNSSNELVNLTGSYNLKLGEAYFFIAREQKKILLTEAQVNTTDPQEIVLRPGWNLIGNPYAVDINWSAVLTRNGIPEVGPLRVLDPNDPAKWPESTRLEKFKGAFVNLMSESNKTITITYADKTPNGGRTSTIERPDYDWYLPLTLEQGDNQGSGSIGMHQQAKVGVDQFDALTLPRWLRYLEITFDHPEYAFSSFSKDIVTVADSYSWEFEVSSDQAGLSKLHWGDAFGNISNLKLLDVAEDRVIDMLSQPGYAFDLQGKKSFKIFFSQDPDDLFTSERISIGDAYPNPFEKQVNIPISLPEHDEDFNVKLEVIDLTGRVFWQVEDQMPSGLYEFTMERPAAMTSGLYLYRLKVLS
ncbi:MAG: hypothetical protein ACI83W_000751, partial [Marinoscillum sp.]